MSSITIKEFVALLGADRETGINHGWLSEKDSMLFEETLLKKDAARLLHEFIKRELNEKDTDDYKEALSLKDIYDCHICVNHIAQVYAKGICDSVFENGEYIFGNNKEVTYEEALIYASRVFDASQRTVRTTQKAEKQVKRVSYEDAVCLSKNKDYVTIDVRPKSLTERSEYHFVNNIPFTEFAKNGKKALGDLLSPQAKYLLYCDNGYLSEVAANALFNDGIEDVFYFGNN